MKKYRLILVIILVSVFGFNLDAVQRRVRKNLNHLVAGKKAINVYLGEIDRQQNLDFNINEFREILKNKMISRNKEKFNVVEDKSKADILVKIYVKELVYLEKDPIDNITGSVSVALDILTSEPYVRMQADFSVIEMKMNKSIWHHSVVATITKKSMKKMQSYPLVMDRVALKFIIKCFGKIKKR